MDSNQNRRANSTANTGFQKKIQPFIRSFYRFHELPMSSKSDSVNIGYCTPLDAPEFIRWFMDKWVASIDGRLASLEQGTDQYADLLGKRGFTFGEYQLLLSGRLSEEDFNLSKIFDYLYLHTHGEREYFIATQSDYEPIDGFIQAIIQTVESEIPILNTFFFLRIPLYYPIKAMKRGLYTLAQSGSGKSELLKIIFYDLQRRSQKNRHKTLFLIEPHGDFCLEALQFSLNKKAYRDRIVYLDPFIRDTCKTVFGYDVLGADYTFVLNPFQTSDKSKYNVNYMTQELSNAFFEILKNQSTTQMDALIEACVETLVRMEGSSIADLKSFMSDDENAELVEIGKQLLSGERQKMMDKILNDRHLKQTKSGIYYRLQTLIGDSEFRKILVGKSTVDLEKEMNSGKVIICNLAKAKMGQKTAPVFGKLLMALIQGFAIKRQSIPKEKRKETFVFVDEFQNYVTPSIETIMAESRKFALHMILANQVMGQNMDTEMRRIIIGNTAIKVAGDNEADSIKFMSENMGGLSAKDFEKLPKYSFFVHNKFNKKNGVQTVRVPKFLLKKKPPFYLRNKEFQDLLLWIVFESGYYKKVEESTSHQSEQVKQDYSKKDKGNKPFYNVDFDD